MNRGDRARLHRMITICSYRKHLWKVQLSVLCEPSTLLIVGQGIGC